MTRNRSVRACKSKLESGGLSKSLIAIALKLDKPDKVQNYLNDSLENSKTQLSG